MIALIWRNIVYVGYGDYYSLRKKLGVSSYDITPWSLYLDYNSLEWTKKFHPVDLIFLAELA